MYFGKNYSQNNYVRKVEKLEINELSLKWEKWLDKFRESKWETRR